MCFEMLRKVHAQYGKKVVERYDPHSNPECGVHSLVLPKVTM
jgi:hypothetical protein